MKNNIEKISLLIKNKKFSEAVDTLNNLDENEKNNPNYYFLKIASRILFIEIVNILKNTKNSPNQPKMTAIDSKLEPKSRCSKFCI